MAFNILGNEKVVNFLEKILSTKKLSHAYLFHGPFGVGKKYIASQFAKAIFCLKKDHPPCNVCNSCIKFENKNHPDYFEIGQRDEKLKQSFSIKQIRELIQSAQIKPNDSQFKVYVLKDVDTVLAPALNAFLKVLEAPPCGVVFLLTATNRFNVFKTVLSRCIQIKVDEFNSLNLEKLLTEKFKEKSKEEIAKAISFCCGSFKRASFFLNEEKGNVVLDALGYFMEAVLKKDELLAVKTVAEFENNSELFLEFLECLTFRLQAGFEKEAKKEETLNRVLKIFNSIERARYILKSNGNVNLTGGRLCCEIFG